MLSVHVISDLIINVLIIKQNIKKQIENNDQ